MTKVALFGSGWIQDLHARAVLAHPAGELVAVANWRPDSAAKLAERHGIPRVTTDWEALAADPEVDAAIVATPNALHAAQAIALLRNGKHVMVEKPMATTVAECGAMIEASRGSGASLMVAHCWRFRDEVVALRDRIAAGELGEVVKTRGYGVHANWGPSGWFTQRDLAGGGALVDMGVHAIDTARFLLGEPVPERVCATVGTRYGTYDVDDDGIVDDLDVIEYRASLADPVGAALSAAGVSKCSVIDSAGPCEILDVSVTQRVLEPLLPDIEQVCSAATPP